MKGLHLLYKAFMRTNVYFLALRYLKASHCLILLITLCKLLHSALNICNFSDQCKCCGVLMLWLRSNYCQDGQFNQASNPVTLYFCVPSLKEFVSRNSKVRSSDLDKILRSRYLWKGHRFFFSYSGPKG